LINYPARYSEPRGASGRPLIEHLEDFSFRPPHHIRLDPKSPTELAYLHPCQHNTKTPHIAILRSDHHHITLSCAVSPSSHVPCALLEAPKMAGFSSVEKLSQLDILEMVQRSCCEDATIASDVGKQHRSYVDTFKMTYGNRTSFQSCLILLPCPLLSCLLKLESHASRPST